MFRQELIGHWCAIHATGGAIDGKWHLAIHWLNVEFKFLTATADNFQFHRVWFWIRSNWLKILADFKPLSLPVHKFFG